MKVNKIFSMLFLAHLMSKTNGKKDETFVVNPNLINPYRGSVIEGYNPIYIPRKGKFKGYMRENRKCSFNKNR